MAGQARKHHFVPQFYLAGFTQSDSKDGELFVLDKGRKATWKRTPKGTAHKSYFHAIDDKEGGDAMAIEKKLAHQEGQWSAILVDVIEKRTIPDDESFGDLMMFVAFMAVRVPPIRNILSDFIDRVSKAQINVMLSTKEGQASFRKTLVDLGHTLSDEDFERLVEFGLSEEYDVDYEQTWHVQEMVRMGITLAPILSRRKWRIWQADDSAPDLICSDRPVAQTWLVPMRGPISPAFETPNTIVSIPLNRSLAMVSLIEEELPDTPLDEQGVAVVNSMTALNATQLYSPSPDFVWAMNDGTVGRSKDLLKALAEAGKVTVHAPPSSDGAAGCMG